MATAKERIETILRHYYITATDLSKQLGMARPQGIYDILHGRVHSISSLMADRITRAYPEISREWLTEGRGDMIRVSVRAEGGSNVVQGGGNVVQGDNNNVTAAGDNLSKALEEISMQREVTQKCQQQIDSLLEIIRKLTK